MTLHIIQIPWELLEKTQFDSSSLLLEKFWISTYSLFDSLGEKRSFIRHNSETAEGTFTLLASQQVNPV